MIESGVATPSVHGQTMTSTATAATKAWVCVGGPTMNQIAKVATAMAMTAGTK
jgi:hypothetical protein